MDHPFVDKTVSFIHVLNVLDVVCRDGTEFDIQSMIHHWFAALHQSDIPERITQIEQSYISLRHDFFFFFRAFCCVLDVIDKTMKRRSDFSNRCCDVLRSGKHCTE
jgi:hypothetical protein